MSCSVMLLFFALLVCCSESSQQDDVFGFVNLRVSNLAETTQKILPKGNFARS